MDGHTGGILFVVLMFAILIGATVGFCAYIKQDVRSWRGKP